MKKLRNIVLTLLTLSIPVCAFDFIVPTGTVRTTTLPLDDPGNSALIEEGGAIDVTGDSVQGVTINAANQTVLNEGRISTDGNTNANGISTLGADNARITNSGQISTAGDDSFGILNNGDNAVITNSGRISTAGSSGSYGITNITGDFAMITSSGLISTVGTESHGILNNTGVFAMIINSGQISTAVDTSAGIFNLNSDSAMITNSGRISTLGTGSDGISNINSDNVMTTNSGRISTLGTDSEGITDNGGNAVITNSGRISTIGTSSDGIEGLGNNVHIINAGTIRSAQASVLNIDGTTPTLSLLRGSNLQGPVDTANPITLNVQTGLNLALTLNTGTFSSFGITAPFAVLGSAIGVIDPTGLAMQTDVVADISDTILNGIYRHKIAFPCSCLPCGIGIWAQGIGSYRIRSRQSNCMGYDNSQGGFLVGLDAYLCEANFGLFGGVSFGEATVDQRTQKADTTSYVAGLTYERIFCNTFLGMVFAAGYVDWDNTRFVMNNLAPGGVNTAKANTGGLFLSPEITLAHRFYSLWCDPSMSFTARYAGLFLGDYTETGSSTNLTVNDREIDLLTTRFEMTLPYTASRGACCLSFEPYAGVFGRYLVGGKTVSANLFGQSLNFDPGSPHNIVALLVGFRGTQSLGCFDLFANIEASFDNQSSTRFLGEGGLGFTF